MFEIDARRAARDIRLAADEMRDLARNAPPGPWQVTHGVDSVHLLALEGHEIAVLTGMWATGTAKYLATVSPNVAYLLAELLWLSESLVRKRELPSRVQASLLALARAIRTP
ncbi:hypothetical protein [Actinocrispum sp. NPDC049592]|uniref:hypothetical protein n=1 Tax=Actinocrispum sp. NPDC049592 TaxID=3154835 RepID=UPI00341B9D20